MATVSAITKSKKAAHVRLHQPAEAWSVGSQANMLVATIHYDETGVDMEVREAWELFKGKILDAAELEEFRKRLAQLADYPEHFLR